MSRYVDDITSAIGRSADDVGDALATAARQGDNASALGKVDIDLSGLKSGLSGGAAGKLDNAAAAGKLDNVADAGKVGKLSKARKNAALVAKKTLKFCGDNPLICASPLILGGVAYVDKRLKDADKKVRECAMLCLPSNYDDMIYGDLDKSELNYTTIETLQKEDPDFKKEDLKDQPFCTANIKDCGDYCKDKCEDMYDESILDIIPGGGAIRNMFEDIFDILLPKDAVAGIMSGSMVLCSIVFAIILFMTLRG